MKNMKIPERTKNMKISVSHVNVYQRVTSAENFNNQVDRMTSSVHVSLFPQPLLSLPNSGHWREEGYAWAQQHGLLPIMADLATATAQSPVCQQWR